MIKVERYRCKEGFAYSHSDTFTKDEVYYSRFSKKGSRLIRSNQGRWVIVELRKMSLLNHTMTKFERIDQLFFRSLAEFKKANLTNDTLQDAQLFGPPEF